MNQSKEIILKLSEFVKEMESKWAWTSLPGRPFAGNKGIC